MISEQKGISFKKKIWSFFAYQTGIQTGIIQEFELDNIQGINNLYTYQKKYDDYNQSLLEGFTSKDMPTNDAEVKILGTNLIMSMNDIIRSESNLATHYQELIELLED